ncbi:hypothetical protein ES705_37062 [subsurface metagenome]
MPISAIHFFTFSGGISRLSPNFSITSALPHLLETERLPCLATKSPPAAATRATTVEILNVLLLSPPVPQVSTMTFSVKSRLVAFLRITLAAPVISSTVSPFILKAVIKAAICAGVVLPLIISFIAVIASFSVKSFFSTNFAINSLIIFLKNSLIISFPLWSGLIRDETERQREENLYA